MVGAGGRRLMRDWIVQKTVGYSEFGSEAEPVVFWSGGRENRIKW